MISGRYNVDVWALATAPCRRQAADRGSGLAQEQVGALVWGLGGQRSGQVVVYVASASGAALRAPPAPSPCPHLFTTDCRPAGERQHVRPGAARQQEAEREWRAQLSPPNGGPAPRPPLSAQAATLPEPGVGAEELGGSPAQNGAPLVTVTDAPAAGEGEGGWLQGASAAWEGLEARYKIIFATSMSFVICNMVSAEGRGTQFLDY